MAAWSSEGLSTGSGPDVEAHDAFVPHGQAVTRHQHKARRNEIVTRVEAQQTDRIAFDDAGDFRRHPHQAFGGNGPTSIAQRKQGGDAKQRMGQGPRVRRRQLSRQAQGALSPSRDLRRGSRDSG